MFRRIRRQVWMPSVRGGEKQGQNQRFNKRPMSGEAHQCGHARLDEGEELV